jgi:hypothetical protein
MAGDLTAQAPVFCAPALQEKGADMKSMSESLYELAARIKQLEDSATAVRDKNRASLQTRRDQLEDAFDREVKEVESAATQATAAAQTWWADTKGAIERQVAAMRTDLEQRKTEHRKERAQRLAEIAEDDAAAAVALATYCLNAAEWAVVDAALARAEADELTAAP